MAKYYVYALGVVTLVLVAGAGLYYLNNGNRESQEKRIKSGSVTQAIGLAAWDADNPEQLLPRSTDLFVARIIEEVGTKDYGLVKTQFSAEVLDSLRGGAQGVITVSQYGGMVGDKWSIQDTQYPSHGDESDIEIYEEYTLKPGHTYLFVAFYNENRGWYDLATTPKGRVDLGIDPTISNDSARGIAAEHPKVLEMVAAYHDIVEVRKVQPRRRVDPDADPTAAASGDSGTGAALSPSIATPAAGN